MDSNLIPLYKGKRKNILVISGGGIKGLSGLGALKCLIDNEIVVFPEIFAGSSVGSIICFLINIGYSPKDQYDLLEQLDFTELVKYVEPENLFSEPCFGISSAEPILEVIYNFMKKKKIPKNITFRELFEMTQSKLIVTGTCINDVVVKYFSVDTYPDMQILKALRISMSIPFVFRPYSFEGKLWVDGGCMNNFPIDLFTDKLDDVIGIYIDDIYEPIDEFNEIQDYFIRIFKCLMRGLNCSKINIFKKYFVHVVTSGNHSTNWEITQDEKKTLFNEGYKQAQQYIDLIKYDN
jgi:NTE family protein